MDYNWFMVLSWRSTLPPHRVPFLEEALSGPLPYLEVYKSPIGRLIYMQAAPL